MGCWNGTCAVTNLPIFEDDEVIVVLLKNHFDPDAYRSSCYPYFYHSVLPLTFEGKYDDYGGVKESTGPALDIIINTIRERLVDEDQKTNFDVDALFELDNSNELKIEYFGWQYTINAILILKSVYNEIVEKTKTQLWTPKRFEYPTLKDVQKTYPQFLQDLKEFNSSIKPNDPGTWMGKLYGQVGFTMAAEFLSKRAAEGNDRLIPITVPDVLVDFAEKSSDEDTLLFIDNAMRLHFFEAFYFNARMMFHVPSGRGSQDPETKAQMLRAKITLNEAKKIKKRWEE